LLCAYTSTYFWLIGKVNHQIRPDLFGSLTPANITLCELEKAN